MIACGHDHATVADDVADSCRIGADNGKAARHGLERSDRKSLVPGREHVDVAGRQDLSEARPIVHPPVHELDTGRSTPCDARPKLWCVLPGADEQEAKIASGPTPDELGPAVEKRVEALASDLHLPVPHDEESAFGNAEHRPRRQPVAGAPCGEIDGIRDPRDAILGNPVALADAHSLGGWADDEPTARAKRERPNRSLEPAQLVVGSLKDPEDGDPDRATDTGRDVEPGVFVLLAEDRATSLVAERARQTQRWGSEVRREVCRPRPCDRHGISAPAEPPLERPRSEPTEEPRRRQEEQSGSRRSVRGPKRAGDMGCRADQERAHPYRSERCRIAEHPAAGELVAEGIERDAKAVQEVMEHIAPRHDRDDRLSDVRLIECGIGRACVDRGQGDNVDTLASGPLISSPEALAATRRSRRHPRFTQPDYLHLRALLDGLRDALATVRHDAPDVLDVWCGTRPYDDLLPPDAHIVGLDVAGNPYGVADVVSSELIPFPDASFDVVLCVQAFQYMPDAKHAVSEFSRVLRPGGTAIVSLVLGYEYERASPFEGRYTEHQLRAAFAAWSDVEVSENGGRSVAWGVLTGSLLFGLEQRVGRRLRPLVHPAFAVGYAAVNGVAASLGRLEHTDGTGAAFPMNLTLTARKPT